ncbi:LysE family transporter [uncultured Jannaschia sp.]|uniref:LysE family translocator n=1 Tax=uncultured Jannaschia sp. TaxID=293347 RepID=UPI002639B9DB|nr:LysE family transporter [uncultured Jannaschia sp.]
METLTLAQIGAFNAALLIAVLGPGPAFLVAVQASLTGGRAAGIVTGAGLALMAALWTLAALLGLEALFELFPYAYTALRIGGALLVLVIAVQVWRGARRPIETATPPSTRRAFARGFFLNLGNPKSIIFSAGVLLVIFPPDLRAAEIAFITLNHFVLELVAYAGVATLLARDGVRARYLAAKPLITRAMALVLGGLGLRLLVTT